MFTPPKKSVLAKQSFLSTAGKSPQSQSSPVRASGFVNIREIPLDPKAQYAISYIPGMVEHDIDTGKTLDDARMKNVLLTCELERVNSYNYSLVRENEVLRVQANKSERERDLETKLAIVLAENEKLNQVIEEVYEVYMSQRGYGGNQDYENRIAGLYEDLEDWKQRYNVLKDETNVVGLQNAVKDLQTQKDSLTEQLARKDRDLEAIRARLAPLETSSFNNSAELNAENAALRKELEALKLKYGKADGLQLKLADYDNKIKTILAENEKLNGFLMDKVNENKDLKQKLDEANSQRINDIYVSNGGYYQSPQGERTKKAAPAPVDEGRLVTLTAENDDLRQHVEYLKNQLGHANEFEEKLQVIIGENQRLVGIINDRERELSALRDSSNSADRLGQRTRELLSENDNLHRLLDENSRNNRALSDENNRLKADLEKIKKEVEDMYARFANSQRDSMMISEYREKIILITQENDRLNNVIDAKTRELEGLQYKVYEAQNSAGLLSDLQTKLILVSTENERLLREVDALRLKVREDKTPELQSQINYLTSEKYRLESLLKDKERELENLGADQRRKFGDLEARLSQLLTLESRVSYFNVEIERLQKDLADKDGRVQLVTQKLAEKDREAEELRRRAANADNARAYEVEEAKNRAQAEQEKKIAVLRAEMEGELRRLITEKQDLENRTVIISSEFERLQDLIKNVKGELEEWKFRYAQLERERANNVEFEQMKKQFESLKLMNVQIKDLQHKFAAERTAYETQILQLGQVIQDCEYQNEMLASENERLTKLSIQRLNEIKELMANNNEDSHKLEIYELRNELERVKSSSYDIKQLTLQFNAERNAAQSKINELTQMNISYKSDLEKLQSLIEQRRSDSESLSRQNEDLRKICEKLNQQNKASASSSFAGNIEKLENRVVELELAKNDYQRQAERNAVELTRKNRELVEKINELDVLKLRYEEAVANYQALNTQLFARLSVKN